jgi:hypothetical protein
MAGATPRVRPRRGGGWLLADGYARHAGDAIRLVAGCVVLLLTALAIHKDHVGSRETAVFRLVNDLRRSLSSGATTAARTPATMRCLVHGWDPPSVPPAAG